MTNPIDIIANAIRARHGLPPATGLTLDDGFAEDVATALSTLDHPEIVRYAAEVLRDDANSLGLPAAVRHLSSGERRAVALVVLHSIVGGA
jgi:hypothetical protein